MRNRDFTAPGGAPRHDGQRLGLPVGNPTRTTGRSRRTVAWPRRAVAWPGFSIGISGRSDAWPARPVAVRERRVANPARSVSGRYEAGFHTSATSLTSTPVFFALISVVSMAASGAASCSC